MRDLDFNEEYMWDDHMFVAHCKLTGVFLIPYFVFLFFCGIPVFFLETALGQYTSEGGVTAWRKICPMFEETCHSHSSVFSNPHLFQPGSNWSFLYNITSPTDYFENLNDTSEMDPFPPGRSPEEEFWIYQKDIFAFEVVYFTATFPYLMLFILFIRGVTLPGAGEGLRYYLTPDFSKITDPGCRLLFLVGCRDCLALCCLNSATSIFAGFAVFSVLGFMAHDMGVPMSEVVSSGEFVPFFVCVESLATAITDMFPRQLRRAGGREVLALVIAASCFLLGLPLISEGGIVLFRLIDTYGPSGTTILMIACFETIIIAWVYGKGADRFYDNIKDMIGYLPFPGLKYCWLFITPLICGVTLLYDLTQSQSLTVYGYKPGIWGDTFGALLIITPLICIPVFFLISLCKNRRKMTRPSSDLRQAQPNKPILTLCNHVIFKAQLKENRHVEESNDKLVMGEPCMV
ncbi:hypothetical protein FQN60_005737 [Etheostoma spectabile]|uniref:Uncharacterized protein n=1 Tax=Etheostoma spectabile TaxID=54343 RepID=A0A5J5CE90_9PERO|nr:hypothetical protein FQN60_005737 [Etheostoma spectabile]